MQSVIHYISLFTLSKMFLILGYDGVFVALLNCLRCQLLIVCNVFKTLRIRSLKKLQLPLNYKTFSDNEEPALEHEMYKELTHSTQHLKILLGCVRNKTQLFVLARTFFTFTIIIIRLTK